MRVRSAIWRGALGHAEGILRAASPESQRPLPRAAGFRPGAPSAAWARGRAAGEPLRISGQARLRVNNSLAVRDAVLNSLGIGQPPLLVAACGAGAAVATSAANAAPGADLMLLNLPPLETAEQAVSGQNGVASALRPPQLLIDFSSDRVSQTRAFARRLREMTGRFGVTRRCPAACPLRATARSR
jgi:hypothetical protein